MTRNGKIARLPAALREELNQRLLDGEQGKPWVEQRIRQLLGLGPGCDGSKNPELTRPPALRGDPVQASTSQYK